MRRILMAGVAVAALLAMGPATGATVAGGAAAGGARSDGATCAPDGAVANARVMKGAAPAADPNTVSAAQARAMQRALTARLAELPNSARAASSPGSINVPVVWQVITQTGGGGGVSNAAIADQLRVMNRGYRGATAQSAANTPFRFRTKNIVRTANSVYYDWDDADDAAAKPQLRRGGDATLNVYIVNSITLQGQTGILGYATFPGGPTPRDGVVIIRGSLPGGDTAPYNKGDTLTHEVGHWIGLFHTFQNGCQGRGDRVGDTAAQDDGSNIFSCNERLDTCTSKAGRDPVHNFMNYATDRCLNEFTSGQSARMDRQWAAFRAP